MLGPISDIAFKPASNFTLATGCQGDVAKCGTSASSFHAGYDYADDSICSSNVLLGSSRRPRLRALHHPSVKSARSLGVPVPHLAGYSTQCEHNYGTRELSPAPLRCSCLKKSLAHHGPCVIERQPSSLVIYHQSPPSSALQRSLRLASASTESLSTRSRAGGRSRTNPAACPA